MSNRYEQLALIDEKSRVCKPCTMYKVIKREFNKIVKSRNLKLRNLVLKEFRGEISNPRGQDEAKMAQTLCH